MTVYLDLLFALNAVINYLLLRGSAAMGGCPAIRWRLGAAAAVGGLYAMAAVLPGLSMLQATGFQAICAGIMLVIAFGWKRATVKQGLFFFALSFAFSGAVLLVIQLVEPDCVFLGGRAYYAVTTPALLLLAGLSYGLAAVVLAGCGTHTGGDLVSVTLGLEGRRVNLRALRDTGNTLRDPVTGQTILVAGSAVLAQLLPGLEPDALRDPASAMTTLTRQYPGAKFRLVPYHAIGTESGLLLAARCTVAVHGRVRTQLVAFSPTAVSGDGRFEALLGGATT